MGKKIRFEDIRKGDRVRATDAFRDVTQIREGVVYYITSNPTGGNVWCSREDVIIAKVRDGIELIDRPMPEYKNGSYAYIDWEDSSTGEKRLLARRSGRNWITVLRHRLIADALVTRVTPVIITPNESEAWECGGE